MSAEKHYSPSQINTYMRCGAQWEFRYIDGIKSPPAAAMAQGTAYHKGLETNFRHKLDKGDDLPISDVADATATSFDQSIVGVEWNAEEQGEGVENVKGRLKDQAVGLAVTYRQTVAPLRKPEKIEQPFTIKTDQPYTIEGFIDLVADGGKIIEHKTTARTPSEIDASHLLQASFYSIAMGNAPVVEFDYAVKTKTPKILTIPTVIDDVQRNFVLRLVSRLDHAIGAGVFMPNRSSFMCSKRHCAYASRCEARHGGRVKE